MLTRAYEMPSMGKDGAGPNPFRWNNFITRDLAMGTMDDPAYKAAVEYYMPMSRALVEGLMAKDKLDAFVYPTQTRRAARIAEPLGGGIPSAPAPTGIANLTGFPDLIVPAGFTTDDLPVTVSFFGLAFSEPKLIGLGYSFEQATKAIRRPVNTPGIAGATVEIASK
jgi:amidase